VTTDNYTYPIRGTYPTLILYDIVRASTARCVDWLVFFKLPDVCRLHHCSMQTTEQRLFIDALWRFLDSRTLIPDRVDIIALWTFLNSADKKKKSSRKQTKEASPLRPFQERSRPQLADISVENLNDGITMHNYGKFDVNWAISYGGSEPIHLCLSPRFDVSTWFFWVYVTMLFF
jgi:hypothetical protein